MAMAILQIEGAILYGGAYSITLTLRAYSYSPKRTLLFRHVLLRMCARSFVQAGARYKDFS